MGDEMREQRQPAYDAVYARIHDMGDALPMDVVHRNAMIWRSVEAALAAIDLDKVRDEGRQQGRREAAEAIAAKLGALDTDDQSGLLISRNQAADIARGFVGEGRRCTCPDCDVTDFSDFGKGQRRVVSGLDPNCPEHGKGTIRQGGEGQG